MNILDHHDIIQLLLELAVMLFTARIFGELARLLHQPMVVGEIIAGIVLGPTILGTISPEAYQYLVPEEGLAVVALDGIIQVSVVLLLFIAGLEVELELALQQGKKAMYTSLSSLIIPFVLGFIVTYIFPGLFGEMGGSDHQLLLALFIGTVLSITALPVIARVLMDLNLFKTNMGMLVIASAMIIDVLGWLIFAVILSMMGAENDIGLGKTIGITIGFTVLMLTIGKSLVNVIIPWINRLFAWPGGLLSISIVICFLAAAFTEYIGIHGIFGAFIIGVAMGDSEHMSERAKEIVHQFINNIFAPLFFVSIGIKVNFITNFDFWLVLVLIIMAFAGKVMGGTLGARMGGLKHYQSLAVGFAMNTHGALEIILGSIALSSGIINERIYVSIIIMVLVSILVSAPLMKFSIEQDKKSKKRLRQRFINQRDG